MALLSQTIPNLIGGVSQQSPTLRLLSQCDELINGFPSVVEGLKKRPPTTHVKRLVAARSGIGDANSDTIYCHFIDRDETEHYVVLISDQTVKVFDLFTGTEKTVNVDGGASLSYLNTDNAHRDVTCLTIGDYTFICNKTVTPAMSASLTATRGAEALAFVAQTANGTEYKIDIDGVNRGVYQTADTGIPKTTAVASDLKSDLDGSIGGTFTTSLQDSTLWIRRNNAANFTITVSDSKGGDYLKVFKGTAQRFSDLPATAPAGMVIEVKGDQSSSFDNYYVKFVPNNAGATFDRGQWIETVAQGIKYSIDAGTMPHVLVRESDGTFTFKRFTWDGRTVGDEDSNPEPGFIGFPINDIALFRDRLCLLADNQISFSEVSNYGNFWATTVTTELDSDPIHIAASFPRVVKLRYAVPFDEKLVLFSDTTQFLLSTNGANLTKKTVSCNPITAFEIDKGCRPENLGRTLMFAFSKGGYAGVREFLVDINSQQYDAQDISAHVPRYLGANLHRLVVSTAADMLLAFSADEMTKVYPYHYRWEGNNKLQSAWSTWTFTGGTIHGGAFINTDLYLVVERTNRDIHLEVLSVAPGVVDPDQEHLDETRRYLSHLDRRVSEADCTVSYSAVTDQTTITLPYDYEPTTNYRVVTRAYDTAGNIPGVVAQGLTKEAPNKLKVSGDWSGKKFWAGEEYAWSMTLTPPVIKVPGAQGGQIALTNGRTMARSVAITHDRTGYFEAAVNHTHRATPSTYVFNGRRVGSARLRVNSVALADGSFKIPVLADAREFSLTLSSASFLPVHLVSAEWTVLYYSNTKQRV